MNDEGLHNIREAYNMSGDVRNAYKMLVGNLNGKYNLEDGMLE